MATPIDPEKKVASNVVGGQGSETGVIAKGPTRNELQNKTGNIGISLPQQKALLEAEARDEANMSPEDKSKRDQFREIQLKRQNARLNGMTEDEINDKYPLPAQQDTAKNDFAGSSIRRIAALSEETRKRVQ